LGADRRATLISIVADKNCDRERERERKRKREREDSLYR
jgi:hypothetical protein